MSKPDEPHRIIDSALQQPARLVESLASVGVTEPVDAWVVDDGSTRARIDEAACHAAWRAQGTLNFVYLPHNQGIEHALNTGLQGILAADYQYVARLDVADLNLPDRCARQAAFLDAHPEVYLLGSAWCFLMPVATALRCNNRKRTRKLCGRCISITRLPIRP